MIDPSVSQHIRQRLMLNFHRDGLIDILGGMIVITFGTVPLLDETGMHPWIRQMILFIMFGLEAGLFILLKRAITQPRAGRIRLLRNEARKIWISLLVLNLVLLAFFLAGSLTDLPLLDFAAEYQLSVSLGLIFLGMFTMVAVILRVNRFYLYGILVTILFLWMEHLFLLGNLNHHGIPAACLLSGGAMVATGGLLLARFIRIHRDR